MERWILELLNQVVVVQSVFELVDGSASFGSQVFEACPDQEGAANVDARRAALAGFQPGGLLAFAVHLLDLPAEAARLAYRLRRILSQVAGDDPVRAVGGHLNPEQAQLMVFGQAFDCDRFTRRQLRRAPGQGVDPSVGSGGGRVVDLRKR